MSSFLSFEDVKTDKQKRSEVLRGHFAEYEIVEEVGGGVNTGAFGDVYKAVVVEVVDEKGKADKLEKGKSVIIKKSKYNPCYDNDVVYHCIKLGNFKLEIERETLLCLKDIKNVPDFLDEGKEWVCEFDTHTDIRINRNFIVIELIEGKSLKEYIEEKYHTIADENGCNEFYGIPDPLAFFTISDKLIRIVRSIHQKGIIHGDIWPPNIIMRGDEPVLIDFGNSRFREHMYLDNRYDPTIRTDSYCAPERINKEREGRRTDVFSIGGVLYYLATGENPPSTNEDIDIHKIAVVEGIQKRNSALLEKNCGIADIICRSMRHHKEQRPANMDSLLSEIRTFSFYFVEKSSYKSLNNMCEQLKCAVSVMQKMGNEIMPLMVEIELTEKMSSIIDMVNGIYELTGDHEKIVASLCRYLSILQNGDKLLFRSVPKVWDEDNFGLNGRFLSMNRLIAQNGVMVRHLFLLTSDDFSNEVVNEIIKMHVKVKNDIDKDVKTRGNYEVYFRVVDCLQYDHLLSVRGWQKGIIVHKEKAGKFIPVSDSNGVLRTIRFLPFTGDIKFAKNDMQTEINKAKPIENFFSMP